MASRVAVFVTCVSSVSGVSPIEKVTQMLVDLETKVKAEGKAEAKAFKEFTDWCTTASKETKFNVKSASAEQENLEATIGKSVADSEEAESNIESFGKAISVSEADLKEATGIRNKELEDFKATETELVETVETLDSAVRVLEREMKKNPALLQKGILKNQAELIKTLKTVIAAASVAIPDQKKLLTLFQDQQKDADDGDDSDGDDADAFGAPAAAAYQSQSGNIVDVLEDMKEKAESELAEARKAEASAVHNFNILKQSLDDQITVDTKNKEEAEARKLEAAETKAKAEGNLEVTVKDLNNAKAAIETISSDCMTAAADQESSARSRAEELAALAKAKEIISSSTSGASDRSYSLLQFRSVSVTRTLSVHGTRSRLLLRTSVDLAHLELVDVVKRLAKEQHSSTLAQLASRINVVFRYGTTNGEDPMAKVKEMIKQMITKLEDESAGEASQKAYCDEEMRKTADKKDELSASTDRLGTKVDRSSAGVDTLKQEIAQLQKELSELTSQQLAMDTARQDEHAAFEATKADLQAGVDGVQRALVVLRDYYGSSNSLLQDDDHFDSFAQQPEPPATHDASSNAGGSIISMLEVVESDFSKALASNGVAEETAQSEYEQITQENKVTKALKEQDVKYKGAEEKSLRRALAEQSSDLEGLHLQLGAVLEYTEKLKDQCVAKPDTYEERKARREAEIAGLKEALTSLSSSDSMLQRPSRHLRGA